MASDLFAAVHVFYASRYGIVVMTRSECHKVLYRWGIQRSPIQAALLSAKTGEVEAGAEGIHEIDNIGDGWSVGCHTRKAESNASDLSLALCCAKPVGNAAPHGQHVAKRMHRKGLSLGTRVLGHPPNPPEPSTI